MKEEIKKQALKEEAMIQNIEAKKTEKELTIKLENWRISKLKNLNNPCDLFLYENNKRRVS